MTLRRFFSIWVAAALLVSCGGGGGSGGGGSPSVVAVYTSFGSVQCSGGGTTLTELQRELLALGIQVLAARCGLDGLARFAVCGEPDGRIAMFDVDEAQVVVLLALGFALLSTLPNATATPCS
jgi:hypothetical protein